MRKLYSFFTVFFFFIFSAAVRGEIGRLSWGSLEIKPRLGAEAEWNDNIYLERDDKDSDFITRIKPGISLEYPFAFHRIKLGYDANLEYYGEHSELDAVNYTTGGEVLLRSDFFSLSPEIYYASQFRRPQEEVGERDRRMVTRPSISLEKELEKITAGIDYTYEQKFFKQDKDQDRKFHRLKLSASWKFSPNLQLGAGYERTWKRFPENPDRDGDDDLIEVGLSGRLPGELTGGLGLGYAMIRGVESEDKFIFKGSISRPLPLGPFTSVALELATGCGESVVYAGPYTFYRGRFKLNQAFSEKLTGSIPFTFTLNDYSAATTGSVSSKEKIIETGLNISYNFRSWLSFQSAYLYSQSWTRQGGEDHERYRENRIKIGARAAF